MLAEALAEEPSWADVLRIEPVELPSHRNSSPTHLPGVSHARLQPSFSADREHQRRNEKGDPSVTSAASHQEEGGERNADQPRHHSR